MYFMTFQRGPRAFVETACQMLSTLRSNRSPFQYLLDSAYDTIAPKLARLETMQHYLAVFLAEVYSEVSKHMEGSPESSDKSLHTLFVVLNRVFPKLETSLRNAGEGQTLLFTHDGNASELHFEILPEVDVESSQWTAALSTDTIGLIYQNIQKLDSFISSQFSSLKEPNHMTVYWLPYTFGAIGLSACSLWLLCHSNLLGSSDMDNWTRCGKELVTRFRDNRVEKPDNSLKELFQTILRTDELAMEQEIQQTDGSLRRYVEESIHPIQNVFSGGVANVRLIQIQELRLELLHQRARLLLKQLEKINTSLAALPAFGLSLLLLHLVRKRREFHDQRGKIARHQRTLLLVDIHKMLMKCRTCMVNGMDEEASYNFGLILYNLDRLYKDVESDAKRTGEWSCVRGDIICLTKPNLGMRDQLFALARLQDMYTCIYRSPGPGPASAYLLEQS